MKNIIIAVIATAVIVGGGAFYGGMRYGKKSVTPSWGNGQGMRNLPPEERQQRIRQFGGNGPAGSPMGNRSDGMVSGEVIAKDATSITVKLRDGGSKIVLYSGSVEVGKLVNGTLEDVSVGANVVVSGKTNSDGSVTAQSIQIRPTSPTLDRRG